jgi:integrase
VASVTTTAQLCVARRACPQRERGTDDDQTSEHQALGQRQTSLGATRSDCPHFHDLRHTCAALLIASGAHLQEVKEHLGHALIRTTSDRYGHLYDEARERLRDRLDATFAQNLADFSRTFRGLPTRTTHRKRQKPSEEGL